MQTQFNARFIEDASSIYDAIQKSEYCDKLCARILKFKSTHDVAVTDELCTSASRFDDFDNVEPEIRQFRTGTNNGVPSAALFNPLLLARRFDVLSAIRIADPGIKLSDAEAFGALVHFDDQEFKDLIDRDVLSSEELFELLQICCQESDSEKVRMLLTAPTVAFAGCLERLERFDYLDEFTCHSDLMKYFVGRRVKGLIGKLCFGIEIGDGDYDEIANEFERSEAFQKKISPIRMMLLLETFSERDCSADLRKNLVAQYLRENSFRCLIKSLSDLFPIEKLQQDAGLRQEVLKVLKTPEAAVSRCSKL